MKIRRPLTPEEVAESARLKAIYEQRKSAAKAAGRSLTQADVAEACGWSGQSAFSQYATGKVPLNVEALLKLAKALNFDASEVSSRLVSTVANVQQERIQPSVKLGTIETWDDETPLDEDEVYVPFLHEVELAAGSGRFAIEENANSRLRFNKKDLRHNGVQFSNAKCVKVGGNSMVPVLRDGATVGVNVGKNSLSDIVDGEMYAINHNGQLRVKQVYRIPTGLRLRSFNRDEHPDEDYTFQQIQEQQISILGHVFWWAMYSR
ncbi:MULTISPECIES: LexA family transcriptional regulator [unclassified Pseudomonas]|uniref:LexA family transcriptional regulator n=1 Tax=unclassified Pseudomonas TaxID=196821 RepID=UPI000CD2B2E4|nr:MULTISPECIES: LexA family transcriptional regulator [unclassified Pseudomonas]POA26446.1 XRE family transcriptional regulator [Pseudomonas sp. FW305-3-2-15-E-TSA4]POA44696.1 XRE family transcriptional regulator [Pseudomonas sp. FW305-3-2-15-E-TSA2]